MSQILAPGVFLESLQTVLIKHTVTLQHFFIKHALCVVLLGTGRVPDQLVNLDMKHGVEAKNYEEVGGCQ